MRAQTVHKRAYIFDFDETIVTTEAKMHVLRNGVHYKSFNTKEFNAYVKQPGDTFDFSDFNDGELILKAKKYKMWPVLKNVSNAVKEDRSTSEIFILTARAPTVRSYIYEYLKRNGIDIEISHIFTLGDNIGKVNISEEKRKVLHALSNKYDAVFFFDDDPKNIQLAKSVPGIKTRLIENKINN